MKVYIIFLGIFYACLNILYATESEGLSFSTIPLSSTSSCIKDELNDTTNSSSHFQLSAQLADTVLLTVSEDDTFVSDADGWSVEEGDFPSIPELPSVMMSGSILKEIPRLANLSDLTSGDESDFIENRFEALSSPSPTPRRLRKTLSLTSMSNLIKPASLTLKGIEETAEARTQNLDDIVNISPRPPGVVKLKQKHGSKIISNSKGLELQNVTMFVTPRFKQPKNTRLFIGPDTDSSLALSTYKLSFGFFGKRYQVNDIPLEQTIFIVFLNTNFKIKYCNSLYDNYGLNKIQKCKLKNIIDCFLFAYPLSENSDKSCEISNLLYEFPFFGYYLKLANNTYLDCFKKTFKDFIPEKGWKGSHISSSQILNKVKETLTPHSYARAGSLNAPKVIESPFSPRAHYLKPNLKSSKEKSVLVKERSVQEEKEDLRAAIMSPRPKTVVTFHETGIKDDQVRTRKSSLSMIQMPVTRKESLPVRTTTLPSEMPKDKCNRINNEIKEFMEKCDITISKCEHFKRKMSALAPYLTLMSWALKAEWENHDFSTKLDVFLNNYITEIFKHRSYGYLNRGLINDFNELISRERSKKETAKFQTLLNDINMNLYFLICLLDELSLFKEAGLEKNLQVNTIMVIKSYLQKLHEPVRKLKKQEMKNEAITAVRA